jgi:signal transduction histidine kinase
MTLRKRTFFIIGAIFLGLVIILLLIFQGFLLRSYEESPTFTDEQVQSMAAYFILSIVGVGIIFGVATIFLLEKQVISRLSRLNKNIGSIGKSGDISARVSVKGTDELSNVANTINELLTALQKAESKLQKLYKEEKTLRQDLQTEINKRVEFTRVLVHEIKTPLTPVVTASELLLEELKEKPALSLAQSINKGAYNLNRKIDELLDLARGEVGKLKLRMASVSPTHLLKEIADDMIPVAQHNSLSLSLELPQYLPSVWADEDRLRQVILNLINNAIKFTPAGGKITLRAKKDGDYLLIEIQDTGHGISKEDQQWLFEPYYQIEGQGARHIGLGLGLSLSKELVQLHGGHILLKSKKGKGSTFSISIPFEATK